MLHNVRNERRCFANNFTYSLWFYTAANHWPHSWAGMTMRTGSGRSKASRARAIRRLVSSTSVSSGGARLAACSRDHQRGECEPGSRHLREAPGVVRGECGLFLVISRSAGPPRDAQGALRAASSKMRGGSGSPLM